MGGESTKEIVSSVDNIDPFFLSHVHKVWSMSAFHLILCEHIHESVSNIYLLNFKIRAISKMNFLFECKKNEFFWKFKTFFSKNWRKNSFVYVWMHKGKLKKLSRKKEFLNFNFLQTDENHSPFQHLSFKSCEKLTDAFQLRTSSVKRHFMKCKRIEEGLVSNWNFQCHKKERD